jgi:hypothetical protein
MGAFDFLNQAIFYLAILTVPVLGNEPFLPFNIRQRSWQKASSAVIHQDIGVAYRTF